MDVAKSLRKGVDTVPHLNASGKPGECRAWSCEPDLIAPTPRTPENRHEVRSRHKRRTEPGEISLHWGLKIPPRPDPGATYGMRNARGENVEENFRSGQKLGIAEYMQSRGESIYYSKIREPLGATYRRGHTLPEAGHSFGKALPRDEFDAKETIFPRDVTPDLPEDRERYKKTHQDYDPGETARRQYIWPDKIACDPHFRFGMQDQDSRLLRGQGVKGALTSRYADEAGYARTRVVKRTSEDHRQVANDQLGSARNMLQGEPPVPAGHAFGLKGPSDLISAAEAVRGFYSVEEQAPDHDLGRCALPGRRNFATRRPFGIPSVRTDVIAPPPERRSVANATNYGDDHSAFTLIYPSKFGYRGVKEADFIIRRPKDDLRALLMGAGYSIADEAMEEVWDVALQVYGDGQPLVSLEVFTAFLAHRMSTVGEQMHQSATEATMQRRVSENADIVTAVEPGAEVVHGKNESGTGEAEELEPVTEIAYG